MKNVYITAAVAAAGLLATASGSRPHNRMKLPSFPGIAEVRASIPGRLRLYMPAVVTNDEAAQRMKERMESTGAVREVRLNRRTGSALFLYDERQVEAAVVEGAAIRLLGLDDAIGKPPVSRMEKGAERPVGQRQPRRARGDERPHGRQDAGGLCPDRCRPAWHDRQRRGAARRDDPALVGLQHIPGAQP